jgi:hypothetical protein
LRKEKGLSQEALAEKNKHDKANYKQMAKVILKLKNFLLKDIESGSWPFKEDSILAILFKLTLWLSI